MAHGIGKNLSTVIIGGGTGFLGKALTNQLKNEGYDVLVISRKPGLFRITWGDIEKQGLPECTAVVNLAGQNVLDPTKRWTEGFKQTVYSSRVNTTLVLANAISAASKPPKVFTTISGVGYYKPSLTDEYTEDSTGGNFDFLSQLCTDWEAASKLPSGKQVRQVTVRSGVVLGRNGGMIKQIFLPFYFGLGGPVGSGNQYMPWIHLRDIVGIIVYSIKNHNVKGILNAVAPQPITNMEFSKAFGRALWRPALFPLPTPILNLAFSPERAKIMTEGQKVIPKRTLEYGYKYHYPDIDSACKEFARLIYADDPDEH